MQFGDSNYFGNPAADYFHSMDQESHERDVKPDFDLSIADIGMSVPLGIAANNIAGIYSKIRMGTGNIELQFAGYGSGRGQQQTPEMYGQDQRQAIREMAMANDVDFTTHATFSMMGMLRDARGEHTNQAAEQNLRELKRAIDFQSDIAGSGSVVMHSGEFDRPVTDMHLDDETGDYNLARDEQGRLMFKQFPLQDTQAAMQIMDDRTGQVQPLQKDKLISYPVWNRAKESHWGEDVNGNRIFITKGDYLNYTGQKVLNPYDPEKGRVPELGEDGQLKSEQKSFDYFRREAAEYNKWFEHTQGRKPNYYEKMYAEEAFARAPIESQEASTRGFGSTYETRIKDIVSRIEKLKEARDYYEKLDSNLPEDEKWRLMRQDTELSRFSEFITPTTRHPLEMIEKQIKDAEGDLYSSYTTAYSYKNNAKETAEQKEHLVAPIKMVEKNGVRRYAEAGIHAMRRSPDPKNPVVVAIEHIFPEQFGGHPEELKWIIKKSRERMVDLMTEKKIEGGLSAGPEEFSAEDIKRGVKQDNPYYMNISKKEAEKIAERHIKATIDTGHLNMWRKYWQNDPRKTAEQNDNAFNKWAVGTMESLAKDNMIGNVHLADNFGMEDDHLAPGQGNSPIKQIMKVIKEHGYDKAITVEPGADASTDLGDFYGLMKTWRFFGSPVGGAPYGGSSGTSSAWGDVHYAYFGQNRPPNYIFGAYTPSNEWTLWSQVPLE